HPGGPHRRHLGETVRTTVRGTNQNETRQLRGPWLRVLGHDRTAWRLVGIPPRTRPRYHSQIPTGSPGPYGRAQSPRTSPSQITVGILRYARQTFRLLIEKPRRIRNLYCGG